MHKNIKGKNVRVGILLSVKILIVITSLFVFFNCDSNSNDTQKKQCKVIEKGIYTQEQEHLYFYNIGVSMKNCKKPYKAEKYLLKATHINPEDDYYGYAYNELPYQCGYFPNLYLGVLYYLWSTNYFDQSNRNLSKSELLEKSLYYLKKSNTDEDTDRSRYYAEKVIKLINEMQNKNIDKGPIIEVFSPKDGSSVDSYFTDIKIKVTDIDYIESIKIVLTCDKYSLSNEENIDLHGFPPQSKFISMEISHCKNKKISIENKITIEASDYANNTSSKTIFLIAKPYSPN